MLRYNETRPRPPTLPYPGPALARLDKASGRSPWSNMQRARKIIRWRAKRTLGGSRMNPEHSYNAAVDFVDRNVSEGRGSKPAFIDPKRTLTYAGLLDSSARAAAMLARLGLEPEQRIAMVMLDTVDFPILFWGAIRAGIVPVLLNTRLTQDQYRHLFADMRAKAVFVADALLPLVSEAAAGLSSIKHIVPVGGEATGMLDFDTLLAAETEGAAPAATSADEVAFWLYSSGSTGNPKGVMHVHTTPRAVAQLAGQLRLGVGEGDTVYSAAKSFFAYGLANSIFTTMWAGATAILYPERPTPEAVFDILRTHQPSVFFGVPTLYASILSDASCTPATGSQRLRLCVSAGEPLPPHVGREWKQRFGVDIVNAVGCSEMAHMFLTQLPGAVDYESAGIAVEGYQLKLVDAEGNKVADGELGELLVRGPSAAAGYWNQRDKTRRTFEGEWTRTGDKYTCQNGVYTYHGRADDMFKVSGIWVSPFEVEAALISHDSVLEAAVVPAEDDNGLIKPKAFVVLKDGQAAPDGEPLSAGLLALSEALKQHVKLSAGQWKYPRWIVFTDTLPKTATGKIRRHMLR
jgi:4-hydroxybenzoate-CoA ligase